MRVRVAILWLLLLCSLFGCQAAGAPLVSPTPPAIASFKVALLLPRPVDADSWTRAGYAGLLLIQSRLGAEITYSDNVPEANFETVFRQYAQDDYDFIIGHGNQFIPAAEKVAAEFPHTAFAITGKYGGNNVNLGGLSPREGEMAYLFGVIAAIKTRTQRVGYIGGEPNASQSEITELYQRGVQATDPNIQVTIDMVGNFTDSARAQQLAQAQINAGDDVIFVLAGEAGAAVHQQAKRAGIYTLGWIEDLHSLAPDAVLTSNIQDVATMLLRGATLVKEGRWEGKQYKFGLADGVQRLAPFYGLISDEQEQQINQVENDLIAGNIDIIP